MEPPTGFLATQWNFICFLPYFIGLLLLGTIKDDRDRSRRGCHLLLIVSSSEHSVIECWKLKWLPQSGEDKDDDEDDTEALLAELEQIKRERAEEKWRKIVAMEEMLMTFIQLTKQQLVQFHNVKY